MITHDPFQNFQAFGAYSGLPYTAFQPFVNPSASAGQPLPNPGIGGYGIYPQPFQGAGLQGAGIVGQQTSCPHVDQSACGTTRADLEP